MLCYAPKLRTPRYRSEERLDLHVRHRSWKEPAIDCLQIGFVRLLELTAQKKMLVLAFTEILEMIALKKIVERVAVKENLQSEPDADSAQVFLQQEGGVFTQACYKEQDKKEKQSHDIFIYGSDSSRIQHVLDASLEEAKATEIPRISVNGLTIHNTITYIGLRTVLEGQYRALNEPDSVMVVLENCCENLMRKFEMTGFRENLQARGVKITVVVWSCIQHGKSIDSNLLVPFTTKLFIPSFKEEKAWLDECGCCKRDVPWNPNKVETTLSIAPELHVPTKSEPKGFANTNGVVYTEVTFQNQPQPGPSTATTALVGQSNAMSPAVVNKNVAATTPAPSLPSYKSLRDEAFAITNTMVQEPRSLQPEAQTVKNSKATENELDKQWVDEEPRGCCDFFADCCVAMFECL